MTRIGVQAAPGRARLDLAGGPISPRVMQRAPTTAPGSALVATTALLLGGDHVEIDIEVGPGAWLEVVETAGTVAYDAEGVASSWTVRVRVADGGVLIWAANRSWSPTAPTFRSTVIELGAGAVACLRETLVLGRTGETGGAIRSRLTVSQGGRPLLVEDLDLRDPGTRSLPGILGPARVIDTVALFGARAPADPAPPVGHRFELDRTGSVARALTIQADTSPLAPVAGAWQAFASRAAAAPAPVDSATNRPSS